MAMTLRERKDVIKCIPWVKEIVEQKIFCEAKTTRYKPCKRFAHWRFRSLLGEDFHYCFEHLIYSGFGGDSDEHRRFGRWWKRNIFRFVDDDSGEVVEPPE